MHVLARNRAGASRPGCRMGGMSLVALMLLAAAAPMASAANQAPSFTAGPSQSVLEDCGACTVANWATAISQGVGDTGQTVTFIVSNDNNALFSVQPAVASNGTLTYTPAANANGAATVTVQAHDDGGTAGGGVDTSAPQTVTITVIAVNDAPTFVKGSNVSVREDSGPASFPGWATGFSPGPPDEAGQTLLGYIVTNTNPALFSVQPAIDTSGQLTFTPAPDAFGSCTVRVQAQDSGGTANGGIDLSALQSFSLYVLAVNDAPSFVKGADQSVPQGAGAQTVLGWATGFSPGPANESSQTVLAYNVTTTNGFLFNTAPAIDTAGTLTYTPAPIANGVATVTVTVRDNGGTANGGVDTSAPQTFTITVIGQNQVPSFTKGADQSVLEDCGARTVAGWATAISAGINEPNQTVTFIVANDNNAMFSAQPAISSAGALTYTPAANANGVATVTVQAHDNGGTANGGIDTSAAQTFLITVIAVNDAPSFVKGPNVSGQEDSGPVTIPNWATGFSPGPADESSQTILGYVVTNTNNALFSVQPWIDTSGALHYTPAPDANGGATVRVQVQDSGGTANGGVDLSAMQSFALQIVPVNDPPSFTKGPDLTRDSTSGPVTVASWATGFSPGPANESTQTVLRYIVSVDHPEYFTVQPAVDVGGTLTFTPVPGITGTAQLTVSVQDNGGTARGGIDTSLPQTSLLTLVVANHAPSFAKGADQVVLEDCGSQAIAGWATAISAGPGDVGQTVDFLVSSDNPAMFATQPAVSSNGTLSFVPAADANGVANVTVRAHDNGGTANGGVDTSAPQTFVITVTPVNDRPSFIKGADVLVLEDSAAGSIAGWATGFSPGPANESGQTLLGFVVSNDTPSLFSTQPAISPAGTLTYALAPDANGVATVTVQVQDNGGTANGGIDLSLPQTFSITVVPVNDPPSFTKGADETVAENGGPASFAGWATGFSPGPANESSQTLLGYVVGNDNPSLFSIQPAISPAGTLTFTPATNAIGSATVTVQVQDSGGTANGGQDLSTAQTFAISVVAVNQPPTFTKGADVTVLEDSGTTTIISWATGFSPGPANESTQTLLGYQVANSNPSMFSVQPAISTAGTLTFTPAANANGVATVTVRAQDNGGTAGGGQDLSAPQTFLITVTAVNDAPSFVKGPAVFINEDCGPTSIPHWVVSFSPGPPDEAGQTPTYLVSNTNPSLFSVQPAIDAAGTLTCTPAPNAFGSATVHVQVRDSGGTANGGVDTSPMQSFSLYVVAVNDPPSFTKGADQVVAQGAGAQTVTGWATGFVPGPANESTQTVLAYLVTTTNANLFSVAPAIDTSGTLTYTPAAIANGVATVTVSVRDNGGTANGGIDTSAPQTFTITVLGMNQPPSFTSGPDQTVLEDCGARTVAGWATSISCGANESGQTVTFLVSNDNSTLFSAQPAIATNGTLTFTPAPNANGMATVTVQAHDNGGTANGGVDTSSPQTFIITVIPVNDPPTFVKGGNFLVLEDCGPQTVPGWATGFSPGPSDEAGQTLLGYIVTNNNPTLFSVQPAIDLSGTLTYTPAPNAYGGATVHVQAQDSGGVANGGVDLSAVASFSIQVAPVNDPPSFLKGPDITVAANAPAQSFPGWATAISAGPANESSQTVTFLVTNTNNALFSVQPAIDASGTLTFQPAPGRTGTVSVRVQLKDNGGTVNGGIDISPQQSFVITIAPPAASDRTFGTAQPVSTSGGGCGLGGGSAALIAAALMLIGGRRRR
jgi:hypothetical protein